MALNRLLCLASLLLLLAIMVGPTHAAIYVWKDANGVTNFTDNPGTIPGGVKVEVRSYGAPEPVTEASRPPEVVTQGEFAVRLATELGLGEGLTPVQAADLLSRMRIAPRLGNWELDAPLRQGLLSRLRKLTVAAAIAGRIPIEPEEALFAFDSATALVGISLPEVATEDAPELSRRVAEEPPLPVYVAPAPSTIIHERVIYLGGDVVPVHDALIHPHKVVINVDNRVINKRVVHSRPVRKRGAKQPRRFRHRLITHPPKKRRHYAQPRPAKLRGHRQRTRGATVVIAPQQKRLARRHSVAVRSHRVRGTRIHVRVSSHRLVRGKRAAYTRGRGMGIARTAVSHGRGVSHAVR